MRFKATQVGSGFNVASINNLPSTSCECPMNLKIIVQGLMLLNSPSYLFSADEKHMQNLMCAHSLYDDVLSRHEWKSALLYHILNGLCASIPADNNLRQRACSALSGSCTSS